MKKNRSSFIVLSLLSLLCIQLSKSLYAQEGQSFIAAEKSDNRLEVETTKGKIVFTPFTPTSFEVEFIAPGYTTSTSYSIGIEPQKLETTYKDSGNILRYSAGKLTLQIEKEPFSIAYYYKENELLSEAEGFFDYDTLKGFSFKLAPEEKLLGGGSRVLGMNRRGKRLKLYNQASYGYETYADLMYYSMPVAISSKKYMLVFDNGASGYMDLGATQPDKLKFEAVGGRMGYLVVASDDWETLTMNFTELTGRQPLVPRWALGNFASRMGYHSQKEVETVVKKYHKDSIPLDAVVLDLFWFGPEVFDHMGNLDWDLDSFPRPKEMMETLKQSGVKTILITEPFILTTSKKYEEARKKDVLGLNASGKPYVYDFYFGTTSLIDIFKPEAKKWFWDIYKHHTLTGVSGWWGDLGEPELHPDDLIHVNGLAKEVHNYYGHEWARMLYEGYAKDFPDKRPLILMRSGFVGSQRYGLVPWSGDVNRSWGGLQSQVEISLQMGMQGIAYMHSDLGGFAGDYKDAELYIRWLQYGVFQPVYRTHAQESVPSEPVFWDKETKSIVKKSIELRYQLTPYNYTLAYENSKLGIPMMRPLFYMDNNPQLLDEKSTYLWGDNFLVSPVTQKGAVTQTVYLPKTSDWFNFWNEKLYKGGQNITANLEIEHIPVFVKAGSFIPTVKVFQNLDEYNTDTIILHYYHAPSVTKSNGYMYQDDGITKDAFKKQEYELLNFESEYSPENGLVIRFMPQGFNYKGKPRQRTVNLIVHGFGKTPNKIKENGKVLKSGWSKDEKSRIIIENIELVSETVSIEIK